jgi:hypothetical protein
MRNVCGALLFCLAVGVLTAAAQTDYCFENDGLKLRQTVRFTVTQNKIEGTFESGSYDENTSAETFDFTGTKQGRLLTIKFTDAKPPYELPPGTRRIVWTLNAKSLSIPSYGKNYNNGRYATYTAVYAQCKD